MVSNDNPPNGHQRRTPEPHPIKPPLPPMELPSDQLARERREGGPPYHPHFPVSKWFLSVAGVALAAAAIAVFGYGWRPF